MSDIYKIIFQKKINLILAIIIFILGASLYWFAVRPTNIKKSCSNVNVKPYSQEEKDNAKKKFDDNNCSFILAYTLKVSGNKINVSDLGLSAEQARSTLDGLSREETVKKLREIINDRKETCSALEGIFNSPSEEWERQATDDEYFSCLRKNGFDVYHSMTESQKLESIQQGIDNQSAKMDKLQYQAGDSQKEGSIDNTQSIIQSDIEKTNHEEQARCQQELSEYSSCLAEYNSKMAEHNSCLAESADSNSWRYRSYCSKPSNYCFKPVCAY